MDGKTGQITDMKFTPFLFRFAKACASPSRVKPSKDYYYDELTDVVRWLGSHERPPAVLVANAEGPQTKKCDIEKGDDIKDQRMWA